MKSDIFNLFVLKTISCDDKVNEIDFNSEEDAKNHYFSLSLSLEKKNTNKVKKLILERKSFLIQSNMLNKTYFELKDKVTIIKEKNIINITN